MARRVLIAAGGTGGHIFPALACAEEFTRRGWEVAFVGAGRALERRILPSRYGYHVLPVSPLKGGSFLRKAKALAILLFSLRGALSLLRALKPDFVLGMGGYVSGPVVLAAALLRVHRAVHEQNVVPGLANRLSAPLALRVFVSFEETLKAFPQGKVLLTGNPVRREVLKARGLTRGETFTLFVMGGSQGARGINRAMVEAIPRLQDLTIEVIHQTGQWDYDWVKEAYSSYPLEATVFPFTEEVGLCYARAHLVVSRAGSLTLAELSALGRAAILVPYPFAADDHQRRNAEVFVKRGAARMILEEDLTGERLAQEIRALYEQGHLREAMEAQAREFGRPEAASEIVEECLKLLQG